MRASPWRFRGHSIPLSASSPSSTLQTSSPHSAFGTTGTLLPPRSHCTSDVFYALQNRLPSALLRSRPPSDLAAYFANFWDFKDDLPSLPDPDRGYVAVQQRAAAISFFLTMSSGWRDAAAYCRQYAKWSWARKSQPEEQLVRAQGGRIDTEHTRDYRRGNMPRLTDILLVVACEAADSRVLPRGCTAATKLQL